MQWGHLAISAEVLIALLLLGVVAFLGITFLRRRTISRGRPLVLCAARRSPQDPWREHLIRLDDRRLSLFALGGVSMRPVAEYERRDLELGIPRSLEPATAPDLLRRRPSVAVEVCQDGVVPLSVALAHGDYMALRSWQESAPPAPGNPRVV